MVAADSRFDYLSSADSIGRNELHGVLKRERHPNGCLSFLLLKHCFAGFVSKILETDGLRAVVQNDIVGVRYAWLHERIYFYASLRQLLHKGLILYRRRGRGCRQ